MDGNPPGAGSTAAYGRFHRMILPSRTAMQAQRGVTHERIHAALHCRSRRQGQAVRGNSMSVNVDSAAVGATVTPARSRLVYRHTWPIRLMHWINVVALSIMFFSGLQIFNAHPSLSWGNRSDPGQELIAMVSRMDANGKLVGVTHIGKHQSITTGFLGVSSGPNG